METNRQYRVYYSGTFVQTIMAHSGFEAIDKVFYTYIETFPNIKRKLLTTK